ncbi:MAG: M20/M25/M40 family metallo-hydrolase [Planctomycetota bacterium]
MTLFLRLAFPVAFACACHAPANPAPPATAGASSERLAALVERALGDNRAIGLLRELVQAAPKRLSGSRGGAAAVGWSLTAMQQLGLQNVRAEACLVPCWLRGVETAELLGPQPAPLRVTALGGSIATPGDGVEAEVIEVRSFAQLQELGAAARGKIVFFNRPMPRALRRPGQAYSEAVPQRSNGAIEAGKVGAVAALVRSMTTAIDGFPHTGAMNYDATVPKVPAAAIATVDAELLAAALANGPARVRLRLGCMTAPDAPGANVVGELVGSERPDEIVLIGAHLDAWDLGEGAHDDGAGVAHCLEALRLLRACGIQPRRTIRVVLFANEENGLRGATAYAEAHAAELARHVAAIETDAGGFSPIGFACSLRDEDAAAVKALFAPLQEIGAGTFLPGAGAGGADLAPLHAAGVPCFALWVDGQKYFDYHHTAADVLAAVNERELALGAAVVAFAASVLADR